MNPYVTIHLQFLFLSCLIHFSQYSKVNKTANNNIEKQLNYKTAKPAKAVQNNNQILHLLFIWELRCHHRLTSHPLCSIFLLILEHMFGILILQSKADCS